MRPSCAADAVQGARASVRQSRRRFIPFKAMLPGLPIPMEHVSAHPMTSQSIRLVRFDGSHLTGTYFTVDCERISRRSVDLTKRKMRRLGSASFVALLAAC